MTQDLTTRLLRRVSRSFYLTLRVLPGAVRPQLSLAYLLARTADTIADSEWIPMRLRLRSLQTIRDEIVEGRDPDLCGEWAQGIERYCDDSVAQELFYRYPECLAVVSRFGSADRKAIRSVLAMIINGQELDLIRFRPASSHRVIALESEEDLDDYTFRVAGCVGEFWTRVCWDPLLERPTLELESMVADGIRLGKALQLINVLRDLPSDLQQGRCYVPRSLLQSIGLSPIDLMRTDVFPRFRPVYRTLLRTAWEHLEAGWRYVCRLPRTQARLRLACAWPVLLGERTLLGLSDPSANVLDRTVRIKVPRKEVYRIILASSLRVYTRGPWNRLARLDRGWES